MTTENISYDEEMGNLIRSLRTREGLSQSGLAHVLGVTTEAVFKWEKGKRTPGGYTMLMLYDMAPSHLRISMRRVARDAMKERER